MGIRRFASVRERPARTKPYPSAVGYDSHGPRHCGNITIDVEHEHSTIPMVKDELGAVENRRKLRDEIACLRANEAALCRRCDGAAARAEEWRSFAIYTQRLLQQELDAYGRRLAAALCENAALREKCEAQTSDCADLERDNSPKCQCHNDTLSLAYGDPSTIARTLRSQSALSERSHDGGALDDVPSNSHAVDKILMHNSRVFNYIDSLAQRIARLDVDNGTADTLSNQQQQQQSDNINLVECDDDNKTISRIRLPSLRLLNTARPSFHAWRGTGPLTNGGQRASSASTDSAFSTTSTAPPDERDDSSLLAHEVVDSDDDDLPPEMPRLISTELKSASAASRLSAPPSPRHTVSISAPVALTLARHRQPPGYLAPRLRIRMRPTIAHGQQCSPV